MLLVDDTLPVDPIAVSTSTVGVGTAAARVRHKTVHDDERSVWARGGAQVAQELHALFVRPVVQDVADEEDGCVLDGLGSEEVVLCESDVRW